MNQQQRVRDALQRMQSAANVLRDAEADLREVLVEAQNPPPHGVADGTVGQHEYNEARAVQQAASMFLGALGSARRGTRG